MRILIADDEPVTRTLLAAAVERLGHKPIVAQDGVEAWDSFSRQAPDVVVTDWEMPGLDGTQLTQRIRHRARLSYTYTIVLTGRADEAAALEAMHAGADDLMRKPLDIGDLERHLVSARRMINLHAQLRDDALTDALTGVGNRRRLDEDLGALTARARRYGHDHAVAILDVDHFKAYNDRFGHLAGDDVLRAVGHRLRETGRGGDAVYRLGGEEFAVVLPVGSPTAATRAAERLRHAVRDLAIPHPDGDAVTVSVGVACAGADPATLLADADAALYRAKGDGRDRVAVHTPVL